MGRIYDVLNSLEQYNLVRSQSAARPKKYVAVEPTTALDRLLADKRRELNEKAEQYENIVDDLSGELETAEPVEERFWTAAVGPEEAADLLVERISATDTQIVMVLSSYTDQFFDIDEVGTLILNELTEALDRGVDIRLLMRPALVSALPESVGERYRESLIEHERFTVRTSENVSGSFTLLDESEVVIEVPHPLKSQEIFAMIDLKDREFAESVRSEFDPRWRKASELTF
jgi:sugar-specific transcriptional regulator TrmB